MKLFTSNHCAGCVPVKKLIEQHNLPIEIFNVDTPEGANEANKWRIRGGLPILEKNGNLYSGTMSCIKELGL